MNSEMTSDEDLSSFEDYLAEFDSSIPFDSEICPTCGIKLSDSVNTDFSAFVIYQSVVDENCLKEIINDLDNLNSPYKIEKRLDQNSNENIKYIFDVLIPIKYLEKARSVKQF